VDDPLVAIGHIRLRLIDLKPDEIADETADAFATKGGFDPRRESNPYLYFRVNPLQVQAWREANELEGRIIMLDGRWLAP
jgi:hypothetical protein